MTSHCATMSTNTKYILSYKSFELKFLGNGKIGVQVFLENIIFSTMEKVQRGQKISTPLKNIVGWACLFPFRIFWRNGLGKDHFVCFHFLTITTHQGHIVKSLPPNDVMTFPANRVFPTHCFTIESTYWRPAVTTVATNIISGDSRSVSEWLLKKNEIAK